MEFAQILGRVLFASVIAVVYIIVLAMFVRRLLGVTVGLGRIIVAGLLGLGAEVGFESRFVWRDPNAGIALLPVQIGIVLIVATLFLVLAELVVPTGTIVRPDKWLGSLRARLPAPAGTRRSRASPWPTHLPPNAPTGAPPRRPRRNAWQAASRFAWRCRIPASPS